MDCQLAHISGGTLKKWIVNCILILLVDDRVIHDVMNDILLPKGRYPENFMMISQWELCQEVEIEKGGQKGWYLEEVEGS